MLWLPLNSYCFLNLDIWYMPHTTSHLSLTSWTFNDPLRLPKFPKVFHPQGACKASPSLPLRSISLAIVSWSAHPAPSACGLLPGHAFTFFTPYCCSHCSLHPRCSSSLCSPLKSHSSVKALLKRHLLHEVLSDPSTHNSSASGIFTALYRYFHFILLC